ncbi:MAG TPA: hypothetical protein VJZ27_03900 [Aggregatilineales bacterium]|nr:hypothetical protein [Aggregatilineales bacterium]
MQNYSRPQQGTRIAAILLACMGWLGLFYLVQNVLPQAGARWLFFVLLYMAVSGSTIPIMQLINNRLRGDYPEPPDWVSVRQGLWMGLFVTTCAWLQIPRQLDEAKAVILAMTFSVIEIFLRLRERGQQGY